MSANMTYHFNKLRERIEQTFESSREKSLALTKLDEAELWLGKAPRKAETDFCNEEPIKSIAALTWWDVTGRGKIALVNYQEAVDLKIEVGETILIDGHKYKVRGIKVFGEYPIGLVVRPVEAFVDSTTRRTLRERVDETTGWRPGDPCVSCGSTRTRLDDDGVPECLHCHCNDGDES